MSEIRFSTEEKRRIADRLKDWFETELGQELGNLDAGLLVDFFAEEMGVWFYNRGLYDAQTVIAARLEDLDDAVLALEKPVREQR